MIISHQILKQILIAVKNAYSECGGILGARDDVIRYVVFDRGQQNARCSYRPDTAFLNKAISMWQERGIEFVGLFHTHFFGVSTLSQGDMEYIHTIMLAMPEGKDNLYFPIVLPEQKTIVPYLAIRNNESITIIPDDLQFID